MPLSAFTARLAIPMTAGTTAPASTVTTAWPVALSLRAIGTAAPFSLQALVGPSGVPAGPPMVAPGLYSIPGVYPESENRQLALLLASGDASWIEATIVRA